MRIAILTLLTVFSWLSIESSFAQSGPRNAGATCWQVLVPGMDLWGTYECSDCGTETSARPDANKRVRCGSCNKPHSSEPFKEPETKVVNGKKYVKNPIFVSSADAQLDGYKVECPSCKASNFRLNPSGKKKIVCEECKTSLDKAYRLVEIEGAPHLVPVPEVVGDMADRKRLENKIKDQVINNAIGDLIEERGSGVGVTREDLTGELVRRLENVAEQVVQNEPEPLVMSLPKASDAREGATKSPVPLSQMATLKKHRLWIVGALAGMGITALAANYGSQPVIYEAEVVSTAGEMVEVTIQDRASYKLTFKAPSATQWRRGDRVWIHSRRWFGSQAYEMENGEFFVGE